MSLMVGGVKRVGAGAISKRFDHRTRSSRRQDPTAHLRMISARPMATFSEPPALLSLAVVLAATASALYYGLRPALRGPLPLVTSERAEVWGVEDPPPPHKRPYVYPTDRPVAPPVGAADREPEPPAIMPYGPTVAPDMMVNLLPRDRPSPAAPDDAPTQD